MLDKIEQKNQVSTVVTLGFQPGRQFAQPQSPVRLRLQRFGLMGVVRPLNRDLIQSGLPAAEAQQHEADTRCSTAASAVNPAKIRLPEPAAARLCGRCQDGACRCITHIADAADIDARQLVPQPLQCLGMQSGALAEQREQRRQHVAVR